MCFSRYVHIRDSNISMSLEPVMLLSLINTSLLCDFMTKVLQTKQINESYFYLEPSW